MSHQERLNFQALGMTAFDGITELPGQQATHPPQDRRTLTTGPNVTNVTLKRLALPESPERPPQATAAGQGTEARLARQPALGSESLARVSRTRRRLR